MLSSYEGAVQLNRGSSGHGTQTEDLDGDEGDDDDEGIFRFPILQEYGQVADGFV